MISPIFEGFNKGKGFGRLQAASNCCVGPIQVRHCTIVLELRQESPHRSIQELTPLPLGRGSVML